ncbi:MAG: acyl-CoA synthetase [Pseudomonadota bacterium]
MLLPDSTDYATLRDAFRWTIPESFNIARVVCDDWAARAPEQVALVHVDADGAARPLTYLELQRAANRLANLLKASGIEAGDRVAILLPQTPETAIAHIAIYKLGAIALPLADLFGVEALEYRFNNSGAKALITSHVSLEKISEIRDTIPELVHVWSIDGPGEGAAGLHEAMAEARDAFETVDQAPDDPALMIYTSGTTGPPKGALHGHRVLAGHLPGIQFAHDFFPQPGDCIWTPADWAWAGGLLNILLPGLYFGVPVVGHRFEKFDPERAFALMAEHQVRNTFLPPTALKMMRAVPNPTSRYNLNVRTLFSGGEAVGRELQDWSVDRLGQSINEVFGQTECNLVLATCGAAGIYRKGAIGKPVPGHVVAIVDGDGTPLPAGEAGAIAVRQPDPVMFLEYWGQPEATQQKYIGDWLITGDQGLSDEDGYVYFVGRDDDVITSSGYRIGPGEIEDCLIGHPAVKLAAAVGKPDELRTEIVKAFIVLNEGFQGTKELAGEIQTYVRERLAAHEYPREIAFEKDLPLTTTGKVIRRLLRDKA